MFARKISLAVALALFAAPALADYRLVTDEAEFMSYLSSKNLSNRLYGLALTVTAQGTIVGRVAGSDVTGDWSWQDGYFCRQMMWGERDIPYNCQLVEIRNGNEMRFTVDRGAGDSASFMLR